MGNLVEYIGRMTMPYAASLADTASFSLRAITRIFRRSTYNSANLTILINQIYFTSVEVLALLLGIAVISGIVLIGIGLEFIKGLGFSDILLRILMAFIIAEVSPLTTVILIALRSSAAMNTEIAVMKVNRELAALEAYRISPLNYLFVPRILTGMISVVILSSLFALAVLLSGLVFSGVVFGTSLKFNVNLLLNATEFADIVILLVKGIALGFFITVIPISSGLKATVELTSIPVAVLNGMVKVFIAIVIIEVLTLIPRFI